jgi:hypothetical protein
MSAPAAIASMMRRVRSFLNCSPLFLDYLNEYMKVTPDFSHPIALIPYISYKWLKAITLGAAVRQVHGPEQT